MPFKTTARHHNSAVIKTEIRIPGNPVVEDNAVMMRNITAQNPITQNKKQEEQQFGPCGWKNKFQQACEFRFKFQS